MNDRFIEALKRLQSKINEKNIQNKEKMDILGEKISQNAQNFDKIVQKLEKKIENQAKINDFSNIEKIIQDINKYSIKDGKYVSELKPGDAIRTFKRSSRFTW